MLSSLQHLREQDGQIFELDPDVHMYTTKLRMAGRDVIRDLQGHGYMRTTDHTLLDHRATARVMLEVTASTEGACDIPTSLKFTRVRDRYEDDIIYPGSLVFSPVTPVTIPAGQTQNVELEAISFGEPFNIPSRYLNTLVGTVAYLDDYTQVEDATGGVDHQITRAITLRALELIHMDLSRDLDDPYDQKRKIYRTYYKDEIDRLVASGLSVDTNNDGVMSEEEQTQEAHGFHRLVRS